jgi:hypothetical protein
MAKHASPRTGTLSRVVDRRTAYLTFRGRVMFDYTEYRVAVGVRAGMSERPAPITCRARLDALIARLARRQAPDPARERRLVREEIEHWLDAKKGTCSASTPTPRPTRPPRRPTGRASGAPPRLFVQ